MRSLYANTLSLAVYESISDVDLLETLSACFSELTFIVLNNDPLNDEVANMIGDVNLFFSGDYGDKQNSAELEVMIAG